MAIGGTIPPIMTAAMISNPPVVIAAVPNTYAALLNGPPISTAIMPATIHPSMILLVSPIELRASVIHWFRVPTAGLIAHMNSPIIMIPSSGRISTGSMLSTDFGRNEKIFFSKSTIYPPANPAINAPRNPETAVLSPVIAPKVHPIVAIYPPTNPTASPGLSAMLLAM